MPGIVPVGVGVFLPYTLDMSSVDPPVLSLDQRDASTLRAQGTWQVQALAQPKTFARLQSALHGAQRKADTMLWDLSGITALDHIGAQWFWNVWQRRRPAHLVLDKKFEEFFERLEQAGDLSLPPPPPRQSLSIKRLYRVMEALADHTLGLLVLLGQLIFDLTTFLRRPVRGPWKEISANIFHAGYQALGITALVGFLIGVVLSYLSAQQLHAFGGDIYLVNILGMSIIRELGPLLAAILVAGRSGSSMTAQLGVMRVTEELDAMLVMGLPHGFRLILPKVLALADYDNVAIKITGACTLSHEPFPYRDIRDPLFRIFDAFGFDRCMWGTDWTRAVALLTYKQGVEAFRVMDRLSDSDRAALMGGTLTRLYDWSPAKA